jgi:hypothetical protein
MFTSSNGEREVPERNIGGTAVFDDEWVPIFQAPSPELDFGSRLAGDQNPRYSPQPESIECRPRPIPSVGIAVQQRPIEIREDEIHFCRVGSASRPASPEGPVHGTEWTRSTH